MVSALTSPITLSRLALSTSSNTPGRPLFQLVRCLPSLVPSVQSGSYTESVTPLPSPRMIRHLHRRIRCGYPFPSPSSITAIATPALISSRLALTFTTNRTHIYQSLDRTRIRGRGYAQEALKTQEEENENENGNGNKGANPAPAPVKTWEKFVRKTYAPRPRPRLYNPTTSSSSSRPVDPVNHANNPGSSAVVPGGSGVTSNQPPQSAGKPVRRKNQHLPTTSLGNLSIPIPTNRSSTTSDWQESTNPDPRNRNRNRNRPSSDTTFVVPDSLDSHDISEIHDDDDDNNNISFDHTPFSYSRTLTTAPSDAYIDAPDHEPGLAAGEYDQVDDLILQHHHNDAAADDADNIESYTPAQTDSIKRGIKDVNGRAARGTRDNPLMGDLDPLEVEMMGVDKLAGGEEQVGFVGFFTDEELEALMVAERARGGGSGSGDGDGDGEIMLDSVAVGKGKVLSSSVLKRTPRAKSRPASNTNPHPTALPPPSSTFQPTRYPTPPPPSPAAALSLSLSSEDTGARYGTDSTGTPTPSRFQWWARATSRHPESLAEAKSVMVMRKSVGVGRLMSGERWFRPVKAYTEQ